MKLKFKDSKLAISEQARFRIRMKEPSVFKTKLTMSALTREQVFNGQEYYEGPIPAQVRDVEAAKVVEEKTEETASAIGLIFIIIFVLMFFFKFGMELFWGSIRNLQVIFTLVLIKFT